MVLEAEIDGDSQRLAARYFLENGAVRLQTDDHTLTLPPESVLVLGVIVARVSFDAAQQPTEEPL